MKNKVVIILVLLILVGIAFFWLPKGTEFTESSFPNKIQGFTLENIKSGEKTASASNTFMGVNAPLKQTFLVNYKANGAVVTLWVFIPENASQENLIAEQMAQNMTKQGAIFKNFNSITTDDKNTIVTFNGPMDGMNHFLYHKNGKAFWASIVTKNDPRKIFDIFYKQF